MYCTAKSEGTQTLQKVQYEMKGVSNTGHYYALVKSKRPVRMENRCNAEICLNQISFPYQCLFRQMPVARVRMNLLRAYALQPAGTPASVTQRN